MMGLFDFSGWIEVSLLQKEWFLPKKGNFFRHIPQKCRIYFRWLRWLSAWKEIVLCTKEADEPIHIDV